MTDHQVRHERAGATAAEMTAVKALIDPNLSVVLIIECFLAAMSIRAPEAKVRVSVNTPPGKKTSKEKKA